MVPQQMPPAKINHLLHWFELSIENEDVNGIGNLKWGLGNWSIHLVNVTHDNLSDCLVLVCFSGCRALSTSHDEHCFRAENSCKILVGKTRFSESSLYMHKITQLCMNSESSCYWAYGNLIFWSLSSKICICVKVYGVHCLWENLGPAPSSNRPKLI